jgi:hypothetical protein
MKIILRLDKITTCSNGLGLDSQREAVLITSRKRETLRPSGRTLILTGAYFDKNLFVT